MNWTIDSTITLVQIITTVIFSAVVLTMLTLVKKHVKKQYLVPFSIAFYATPIIIGLALAPLTRNLVLKKADESVFFKDFVTVIPAYEEDCIVGFTPVDGTVKGGEPIRESHYFLVADNGNGPTAYTIRTETKGSRWKYSFEDGDQIIPINPEYDIPRMVNHVREYYYKDPLTGGTYSASTSIAPEEIRRCSDYFVVAYIPTYDLAHTVSEDYL